jgi:F420-dependent oxidoreductase-like protein
MKVAIGAGGGTYAIQDFDELTTYAQEAEKLGIDTIWSAEAWIHDAITPLAYLAGKTERVRLGTGIMQVGTRTPALAAMTAMTMTALTEGRFILGLGTSGPQVVEGWHGISFARPVARTREYIEVIRRAVSGDPLEYEGDFYTLPLPGGEGKALRPAGAATPDVPIWVASIGPRNLELTGELADGWLGTVFIPEQAELFFSHIRAGAERVGRTLDDIELQAGAGVWFTDDVDEALKALRARVAFSLGGMGSLNTNFYNAAYSRQGYAEEAKEVQRLWLEGNRNEARELVPLELAQKVNLVGTDEMVKDRLRVYRAAGIDMLYLQPNGDTMEARLETLGRVMDLINVVDAE